MDSFSKLKKNVFNNLFPIQLQWSSQIPGRSGWYHSHFQEASHLSWEAAPWKTLKSNQDSDTQLRVLPGLTRLTNLCAQGERSLADLVPWNLPSQEGMGQTSLNTDPGLGPTSEGSGKMEFTRTFWPLYIQLSFLNRPIPRTFHKCSVFNPFLIKYEC